MSETDHPTKKAKVSNEELLKKKQKEWLQTSWTTIQNVLDDIMLPPIIDNTANPKKVLRTEATVALLGEPDCRLIKGIEGGRQSPGNIFLVFTPSWLEKKNNKLFLHQGVWFDPQGQGYLDRFDPPRLVTYFANFLTLAGTEGVRDDGIPFEENLDCPMSSSYRLENFTNDKLHTRCLMGNVGVAYPRCMAFPFRSSKKYNVDSLQIEVIPISDKNIDRSQLLQHLESFLARFKDIEGVVVKPSGPLWFGSKGVSIFQQINKENIVLAMERLLKELHDDDSMMVEEFLSTVRSMAVLPASEIKIQKAMYPADTTDKANAANIQMEQMEVVDEDAPYQMESIPAVVLGFRLRVLVERTSYNQPIVSKFVVGIGDMKKPINGDNTIPQSLDSALIQWGIKEETVVEQIKETITKEACKTLQAIMDYEETMAAEEKGGIRAQTDIIGIDFVLTSREGVIVPIPIEVNDHDCTLQTQMLEFIMPETRGECVRPWVATMIGRSQEYLLEGKRVLVVGAGGVSKMFVWETAKKYKIRVVLVDHNPNHFAKDLVETFICIPNLSNHSQDEKNADLVLKELKKLNINPDGVVTFWEDCGPLTGLVSEKLNKIGNGYEAQRTAKSKFLTHQTLMERKGSWPHKVSSHYLAVPCYKINEESDISKALKVVPLPAVMKIEHGSSAVGVKLVTTRKEVFKEYKNFKQNLATDDDHPGSGLSFGSHVILQEYIDGSEHDVDIVVWNGQVLISFVTDNGPTRLPYFNETSAAMPSHLHPDKVAALQAAAIQCVRELGLKNGVFNVEMKLTACGPRLIEINARTAGFYVVDWIKQVWGVDLAFCAFAIACGIKPVIQSSPTPRTHLVGLNCYSSEHAEAIKHYAPLSRLKKLHEESYVRCNFFEKTVLEVEEFEEPIVNIACYGTSTDEAKQKLVSTLSVLGFDCGSVPLKWYFEYL